MRKLAFAVAALVALPVLAEEAFVTPDSTLRIGDRLRLENREIFYTKKKCELPLVNARHMRKYMFYRGSDGPNDVGCWAATIDGTALSVVPQLDTQEVPISVLMKVDVHGDWSATVTDIPDARKPKR